MSRLSLPRLDDRTWSELVDEAQGHIPRLLPEWTDHNPSDLGITLIELFAWVAEMLVFRIDQISDSQRVVFLKLLNGPDWQPGADLEQDVHDTLAALEQRDRAVTVEDYELLAREANPGVARVRCVPRRNLAADDPDARSAEAPGHVSVVVVPDPAAPWALAESSPIVTPQPSTNLLAAVDHYLDPRRLVTTRVHVVAPEYVPLRPELFLIRVPDAKVKGLRDRVCQAVESFLDPLTGGAEGLGWTFGRTVYVSELLEVLANVPGVAAGLAVDLLIETQDPQVRPSSLLWHPQGDLIGRPLDSDQLPVVELRPDRVWIGETAVPVRIEVDATPAAGVEQETVAWAIQAGIRHFFHPRNRGGERREISESEIRNQLTENLPDLLAAEPAVEIEAPSANLLQPGVIEMTDSQLADLRITVRLNAS